MDNQLFSNKSIISWLQYFSENTDIDLEHVKLLDITKKNKNLIPTVEAHRCVLVFTEAGNADIFYKMWDVGLGDCEVIYNEGSEPAGPIKRNKVSEMIDRGINASAGMIVLNPNARSTIKFGMDNKKFASGSVKYVGSEIRSVLISKMQIHEGKNLCVISGESIAVESAMMNGEGTVIAVEYKQADRETMEENVNQFGLRNVNIVDHVGEDTMGNLPVPDTTMLVASASLEHELEYLLGINPNMEFVIYTLDFKVAASMRDILGKFGITDITIIQIAVSKLTSKNVFENQPAPWIISAKAGA
ncbi:MAG: precorrin-6B methylase [Lachnospiraceae bacterium]|nr:precorrin-6B methylase [Lachnospiraceae bacterium]MBO6208945.1 precorrin-6B methylase [Lachnospiraceae bacterium]MBO6298982.1 precorrin-6B methylase [Lachnospiraceae bacterium]MBP3296476.1 precorrin-6B methylase [Lachnospiraceae bacterium]